MKGRKKRRVLLKQEVIINDIISGHILDLSDGGMYIHTQAEFIHGAKLDLSFAINGRHIKARAAVQHTQPGVGIGIKFLNLPPDDFSYIKKFLECQPDIVMEDTGAKKILLVDDNTQSRCIYRNRLLGEGFNTVEASNGSEALKRLRETKFDLVVLDIWMEGIDGFKILQLMKVNPALKDIPVVILSARSTPADFEKAIALGAKDYLVKMTTTPIRLAEKVRRILGE